MQQSFRNTNKRLVVGRLEFRFGFRFGRLALFQVRNPSQTISPRMCSFSRQIISTNKEVLHFAKDS